MENNVRESEVSDDDVLSVSRALFWRDPPILGHIPKLFVAQYLISHSDSNKEIRRIYEWIIYTLGLPRADSRSQTRRAFPISTSMEFVNNAVDLLLQSNHTQYKAIANELLEHLRRGDGETTGGGRTKPVAEILTQRERLVLDHLLHSAPHNPSAPSEEEVALQHALLEQLQNIRQSATALSDVETQAPRSIFQDKQNTHDHKINETVKMVAKRLCASQASEHKSSLGSPRVDAFVGISDSWIDPRTLESLKLDGEAKSKISRSLERISTDSTVIDDTITLAGTFRGVVKLILGESDPVTKKELGKALVSALQDISGMCFTGHLSGLASVPQGIKPESIPKIEIDVTDEVYATLSHQLTRHLQLPENDEVMNQLADGNLLPYYQVVKTHAKTMLPQLHREYGDAHSEGVVNMALVKAVNKYAKGIDVKNLDEL
jgi:hypothetical protein